MKKSDSIYEKVFTKTLKNLIVGRSLSQKSAADNLNISPQTMSNYLLGKSFPDAETLISISKYFNVSIDYLLTGFPSNTALLPDFINSAGIPLADDIIRFIQRPHAEGYLSLNDDGYPKITQRKKNDYSQNIEELSDSIAMEEIVQDLKLLRKKYWEMVIQELTNSKGDN